MIYSPPGLTLFRYGLHPPGDKFIAHRSILLASVIEEKSRLRQVPRSGDLLRTISSVRELGVEVDGDIVASFSELQATRIGHENTPSILDEVHGLAMAAVRASGETAFTGMAELRVKDSDRITTIARNLEAIGVEVEEREDGFSVIGTNLPLEGAVNASGDHRIAMAFSILGASPGVNLTVRGVECAAKSFPAFHDHLETLANGVEESTGV